MSFFHHLFSPLLPTSSAAHHGLRSKHSPPLTVRGSHADGQFSYNAHLTPSSHLASLSTKSSLDPKHSLVESHYGLGMLLSKAVGLRSRLGFTLRTPFKQATDVDSSPSLTPDCNNTPLSSASENLPETPRKEQPLLLRKPAQFFARATSPKVQWQPAPPVTSTRSPRATESPLLLHGVPARSGPVLSSPRSSPRMTSFLDLLDDDANVTQNNDWLSASTVSDWLSQDPRSPLSSTRVFTDCDVLDEEMLTTPSDPVFPISLQPRSAPSPVPTEPAFSRRAEPAPSQPTESVDTSDDNPSYPDWTRPDRLPTPPTEDLYNSDRDKYPDVVQHMGMSYHIMGMLGEGSYGRVMLAVTSGAEVVALKVMHKRRIYREGGVKGILPIERDCLATAASRCLPFWVQLRAAWEDEHNLYYAMEPCMGTLRDRIANAIHAGTPLSKEETRLMCAEMLLAVRDLREMQLVHSDIKPENFLITRSGRVVLSDFGFAQGPGAKFSDPAGFLAWKGAPAGTSGYLAPEALEHGFCAHQSDVYSLGVVFVELMAGMRVPMWDTHAVPRAFSRDAARWDSAHPSQRQAWLMRNVKFANVSEEALPRDSLEWDLCMQMLRRHPDGEPGAPQRSVEELLAHPYFADLELDFVSQCCVQHDYVPELNMDHFRIDRDKRDLTFEKWHRGKELNESYGSAAVFRPVVVDGQVVKSSWLVDNVNVEAQMDGQLENFEWPCYHT